MKKSKLKHIVFSFALAGILATGIRTVTNAAVVSPDNTNTVQTTQTDISKDTSITIDWKTPNASYIYTGKAIEPEIIVKQNGIEWTKGVDYAVAYDNNIKASSTKGEATATITPIGTKATLYTGKKVLTFTIKTDIASDSSITAKWTSGSEYTYTASAITPSITMTEKSTDGKTTTTWKSGTDYTVTWDKNKDVSYSDEAQTNIISAATATIKPAGTKAELYGGELKLTFKILPKDIRELLPAGSDKFIGNSRVYSGKAYTAGITVTYNNETLKRNENSTDKIYDFKVSDYKNNINAGTASAVVTGHGNYKGTADMVFSIAKKDIKDLIFTPSIENIFYSYTGTYRTPAVSVIFKDATTSSGKVQSYKLKKGTDYSVVYEDNKYVGTANVIFTGSGNFTGIYVENFAIRPKPTVVRKLIKGRKRFKVVWKKQTTQMSGYQIQYATNKKFTSSKKLITCSKSITSKTITKLKAKKTYYVRVRTYKTVDGIKYYSKWSNIMKTKTQ